MTSYKNLQIILNITITNKKSVYQKYNTETKIYENKTNNYY